MMGFAVLPHELHVSAAEAAASVNILNKKHPLHLENKKKVQIRELQSPLSNSSSQEPQARIHVVDLDVELPPQGVSSNNTVRSNGVTFTVRNQASTETLTLQGLDLYVSETSKRQVKFQVFVRQGIDHVSPLEESSDEWTLIADGSVSSLSTSTAVVQDSNSEAEFMSIPFSTPISVPANNGLTLFVLCESMASLVNVKGDASTAGKENMQDFNGMALSSGTAVTHIRQQDAWVPIPGIVFLGKVFYSNQAQPWVDLDISVLSTSMNNVKTLDTMTLAQQLPPNKLSHHSYGLVMDVSSVMGCNITALEFATSHTSFMMMEVYVSKGGSDLDDDTLWALVTKTAVMGQGTGQSTLLPLDGFETIVVPPAASGTDRMTMKTLYITGTHSDSLMSIPATGANEVGYAIDTGTSTDGLSVMVGQTTTAYPMKGNGNGLGSYSYFAGKLHYQEWTTLVEDSIAMTPSPSAAPTHPTTPAPTPAKVLDSTYAHILEAGIDGKEKSTGVTFDLVAGPSEEVVLRGFSLVLLDRNSNINDICRKLEAHVTQDDTSTALGHEVLLQDWTTLDVMVESLDFMGDGRFMVHYVLIRGLLLQANQAKGFRVSLPTKQLITSYPESFQTVHSVWSSYSMTSAAAAAAASMGDGEDAPAATLQLLLGNEVDHDFQKVFTPRGMNGKIAFTTSEKKETNVPTPVPPPTGALESQLKLVIKGLSRRSIRHLQGTAAGGGGIMSNDAIRKYFEGVGKDFVLKAANANPGGSPINIKHFVVSTDIQIEDINRNDSFDFQSDMAQGQEEEVDGGRSRRALRWLRSWMETQKGDERDLQEEQDANLEIYTTILGECSPPPVVDFSALTIDSFNEEGDDFIRDLKEDTPPEVGDSFQEVRSIRAEAIKFPMPLIPLDEPTGAAILEDDAPSAPFDFLFWMYIISAGVAGFVIMILSLCIVQHKKKKKKQAEQDESAEMNKGQGQNKNVSATKDTYTDYDFNYDTYDQTLPVNASLAKDEDLKASVYGYGDGYNYAHMSAVATSIRSGGTRNSRRHGRNRLNNHNEGPPPPQQQQIPGRYHPNDSRSHCTGSSAGVSWVQQQQEQGQYHRTSTNHTRGAHDPSHPASGRRLLLHTAMDRMSGGSWSSLRSGTSAGGASQSQHPQQHPHAQAHIHG
jgi:hypothetical protein